MRVSVAAACAALTALCAPAFAQDLVVTNARIVTGTGQTIDRGSVVVAAGRIVSVSSGDAAGAGA